MGLFDFFKKEKTIEDPTLFNLTKGAILDYDLESWIVKDKTEYDWGNNQFTFEYTVENGSKSMFVHIDDSTPLKLDVSESIKMFDLGPVVKQTIVDTDKSPKRVTYKGSQYFLSDEFLGHCKSVDDEDDAWSEFVNWVFYNEDESEFIGITRWGETEMDAVKGRMTKEFEFSNFLSSPKS
jgi:hypothetical protein